MCVTLKGGRLQHKALVRLDRKGQRYKPGYRHFVVLYVFVSSRAVHMLNDVLSLSLFFFFFEGGGCFFDFCKTLTVNWHFLSEWCSREIAKKNSVLCVGVEGGEEHCRVYVSGDA